MTRDFEFLNHLSTKVKKVFLNILYTDEEKIKNYETNSFSITDELTICRDHIKCSMLQQLFNIFPNIKTLNAQLFELEDQEISM